MNETEYLLDTLKDLVSDMLDTMNIFLRSQDWEISESMNNALIDELTEAILEDKPTYKWKYIKEYLEKHYN